jgi:hypothetical protein
MTLIITNYLGRLGNNILQILRAIMVAKNIRHNKIIFPTNNFLLQNEIYINDSISITNKKEIYDTFFYLSKFNVADVAPVEYKSIFNTYIKPIFLVKLTKTEQRLNSNADIDELYIHIRSGDTFSSRPHNAYVPPPLAYYTSIIPYYKHTTVVTERDMKNPCIHELNKCNSVYVTSNSLEKDIKILSNAYNLVIGFGTFGFLIYLLNENIQNLYIPQYVIDELPQGEWGEELNVQIIELPKYIKCGDWKNNIEQQQLILNYTLTF